MHESRGKREEWDKGEMTKRRESRGEVKMGHESSAGNSRKIRTRGGPRRGRCQRVGERHESRSPTETKKEAQQATPSKQSRDQNMGSRNGGVIGREKR